MTKAYNLFISLLPRLQAVLVANGYLTNAGASAVLGPVPRQDGETYPYLRLHDTEATPESVLPHRPAAKMRVEFMVEGYAEQSNPALVYATGHDLIADIKKAVFGDGGLDLNGAAIDVRMEGYRVLSPEEGSAVVIAQVRGSYSFHDAFDKPYTNP